jgi:hypothetical protein
MITMTLLIGVYKCYSAYAGRVQLPKYDFEIIGAGCERYVLASIFCIPFLNGISETKTLAFRRSRRAFRKGQVSEAK